MTIVELQHSIIKQVLNIKDELFLKEINSLVNLKDNDEEVYQLSEFEERMIKESDEDYKKGNVKSFEEVNQRIQKWLKE